MMFSARARARAPRLVRVATLVSLVSLTLAATPEVTLAQRAPGDTTWDVTVPRGRTREIDFTAREGTWTALDVSPDGTWIVFDLLGHIYRMPIGGGEAVALTQNSGIAINVQPRISPDGKRIAFISDRKAQMNVWVMDADGANPTPVLLDEKAEFRWPSWTKDGEFLVAQKRPANGPQSLMMLARVGGQGVELLRGSEGMTPSRSTVAPDGRTVYYDVVTSPIAPFGRFDVLMGAVQVHGLDLKTGVVRPLTAGAPEQGNADHPSSGGAFGAEVSPDGRYVSFIRKVPGGTLEYKGQRFGPRSALWIRDLRSGAERMVMDPVEMDLSEESFPVNGSYPGYKWMPDGKSIVILQGGKIRRVDLASGQVATIPYTARVHRVISELATAKTPVGGAQVQTRFIRWASTSPDGKTLAFQAFGRIWIQSLPGGMPRRLTPDAFAPFEFQPAWSSDGRAIAFTSWDDAERGALWIATVGPTRTAPRRVTREVGEYVNPAWSADGREIVIARGAGATARGQTLMRDPFFDLVRVNAATGEETFVAQVDRTPKSWVRQGDLVRPTVGTDGRIYFGEFTPFDGKDGRPTGHGIQLASVRADGTDRRILARVINALDASVAPDGRHVAFVQGDNVYTAALPAAGTASVVPTIDRRGGVVPSTALSLEGGLYPHWRNDDVLEFASGDRVFVRNMASARTDTTTVRLALPRDIAKGSVALTGARIITLEQRRVIESGTVVVRDGRIACVGECATTGVDRVVSAAGKTIIPGWVDMHAHLNNEHLGMMPSRNWDTAIYLAFGITTTFDPSNFRTDPFASSELIETGQMIGPRVFTASTAVYNGDDVNTNEIESLDVAIHEAALRKSWGTPMLKQYLQPTRRQRQWVVESARRLGMRTTAEGSQDMFFRIGMVLDGHTGGEHLVDQAPLYSDFLTLLAKADYSYSHTPLVSGYGAWNEEYWWQESPVWQNAKLQQWLPWRELIPHTRRVIKRPETDYSKDIVARSIADLIELGGHSAVGSHGQQAGLGSHWDVWMLAKAAGPMAALEVASMHGARFLGVDADLGSITVGKLADLTVLDGNPLEDIRHTVDLRYVMKSGVLYDAGTLDQLWPRAVPFGPHSWAAPEMYRVDEKRVDVFDRKP